MTAVGIAALSLTTPAHAGGSDVGAALVGFGIGAILGSALAPQAVYVAPPPPDFYDEYYDDYYYGPADYGPPNLYRHRTYTPSTYDAAHGSARTRLTAKRESPAGVVQQDSEAKLKAAQAKAEKLGGVQKLTSQDIDGLSREQLKRLRGY